MYVLVRLCMYVQSTRVCVTVVMGVIVTGVCIPAYETGSGGGSCLGQVYSGLLCLYCGK